MRLSPSTLHALMPHVARPRYDRDAQKCGIVHIGLGAFHRAHQAMYTDDAMADGDRDWGIVGVSLRSADVSEQLQPQDGLYTVTQRAPSGATVRLIGAVKSVLVAPQDPQAVIDVLSRPETHVVTFTVTEKGYCARPDGHLETGTEDVAHDLGGVGAPRTLYGFLARAFAQRRARGLAGLSLVSCDNLADNGARLAALLDDFLNSIDPSLAAWTRSHCTCPATMVDRIVPATTEADREALEKFIGLRDEAAVITEPFRQWVIEDRFAGPRPRWEAGGAQFVAEVRPFETAKLRLLNGAHSALAYLGLRRGHEYVHQAITDPAVRAVVENLMKEAAATLQPRGELDLRAYADALLARFNNSALPHRLMQIAMDGSQKIPQRWLQPLAVNQAAQRACPATLQALAAWILHARGDARAVDDPAAERLAELWRVRDVDGIVPALFGEGGMFAATWTASQQDQATLNQTIRTLDSGM